MNITAQLIDAVGPIAMLILGLLGIAILVLTVLMPVYVYLIYRQGVKTQERLQGYTDGFNKVLSALYHIQQNTTPRIDD